MNAYQLHTWLIGLGKGIADIPSVLAEEAESTLPELQRATPIRSGQWSRSWAVEVRPDQMRVYIVSRPRDRKGRGYGAVAREKGTIYHPGPGGGRLGGHWDKPPLYLDIARAPLERLIQRVGVHLQNLTHPYVPVEAPERG